MNETNEFLFFGIPAIIGVAIVVVAALSWRRRCRRVEANNTLENNLCRRILK